MFKSRCTNICSIELHWFVRFHQLLLYCARKYWSSRRRSQPKEVFLSYVFNTEISLSITWGSDRGTDLPPLSGSAGGHPIGFRKGGGIRSTVPSLVRWNLSDRRKIINFLRMLSLKTVRVFVFSQIKATGEKLVEGIDILKNLLWNISKWMLEIVTCYLSRHGSGGGGVW